MKHVFIALLLLITSCSTPFEPATSNEYSSTVKLNAKGIRVEEKKDKGGWLFTPITVISRDSLDNINSNATLWLPPDSSSPIWTVGEADNVCFIYNGGCQPGLWTIYTDGAWEKTSPPRINIKVVNSWPEVDTCNAVVVTQWQGWDFTNVQYPTANRVLLMTETDTFTYNY
jgi:hypothetical protein